MILKNLKNYNAQEIEEIIKNEHLPLYRAKQIIHWIYKKFATSIDEITELPKSLRESLSKEYYIGNIKLVERKISKDSTEKFLWELEDKEKIESVLITDKSRLTLCISSQVGCPVKCRFCLTGRIGFKRNLHTWEIVDQFIQVSRLIKDENKRITNIVFMGMGEPLLNFENVVEALWRFKNLIEFSPRRITVSTAGIIPAIKELPHKAPSVKLAISLNASDEKTRTFIMPVNKKYPLHELLKTLREYPLKSRERITFEYVMLKGINSSEKDALRLGQILKGIPSKINLIPFNPWKGCELEKPDEWEILKFQQTLISQGYSVFIRKSKGQDILAACGQLKALYLCSTASTML
ncbi:23S rRNA (adenine(2503)-C(2))-methyltransferase RlmN [Thermodesulfovibrio sp. 3907-1M]|uniref:Probable dual-specificity RNA methyltransferase RlmN n=1 Tax=Thermodesulfovibrio autotrophicus TaxID=3118333 RepID=A0AAU8GVK8_9BACT